MPRSEPLDRPQTLYDEKDLQRKVGEVAHQLADRLAAEAPIFISPTNGSLFFLTDLVRRFPHSVQYQLIEPVSPTETEVVLADPDRYKDRVVVLVRDLVTTGVVDDLLRVAFQKVGAREVLIASLIDIPAERRTRIDPDYSVLTTGRDGVLVGYGLKSEGHYGNLPYLGQLPS